MRGSVRAWLGRMVQPRGARQEPRFAASRYSRQRRLGFPLLYFFGELEREYRHSFVALNTLRIRVAHSMGLLACFAFTYLDWALGFNMQTPAATAVLLVVCSAAMLLPLWASFRPTMVPYMHHIMFAGSLLLGLSMIVVVWLCQLARPYFPYESVLLVTVFVYFVSGVLWRLSILCGGIIWLCFVAMSLWGLPDRPTLVLYDAYYLLVANIIGIIGRYIFEYQDRLAFLTTRELSYLSQHDPLTGAMNRRSFHQRAEAVWLQAARENRTVGLVLLDLDHFKAINDRHGHLAGDNVLRAAAGLLRDFVRRPLDAVGRFGGDEFVALWYDVKPEWFEQMIEQMSERLGELDQKIAEVEGLNASGGAVVATPGPSLSLNDALRAADENLYQVKREQRGKILCTRLQASDRS